MFFVLNELIKVDHRENQQWLDGRLLFAIMGEK